ncbi:hypothetical protein Tco_0914609 [Tanacetum coccineum]
MICAVRINVPLVDVLVGMPNYGKFLKELISNKHKIEQISAAFLSDESSAMIQNKVPPKLGDPRSFLIPFKQKQLNLGVGTKRMIFNIDSVVKHSYSNDDTYFSIDVIDEILEKDFDILLNEDLELKPLPNNLEYVFLEEPFFLSVIISSQLSKEKKNKLVSILKEHKEAFAWKTTDIPGIYPSFCKHKIQLLDEKKPVVQKQRRLNLNMQEVVKKEIVKLFDTGIIYPIADSPWVSPIHCVPKKGDITVFTNENDELVPTRTVTGWLEKCHFMVKEGIVLGHKVSSAGLEVDKAKIDVISKLSPPTNIKGVRSFLGHAGFYRRFIKYFPKIARPITKLLEKDTLFEFDDECIKAFRLLKEKLTCAPVIISPNWNLPFVLCVMQSDSQSESSEDKKMVKNLHFRISLQAKP